MQLAHIADRVLNRPLMILPEKLALIASVLNGRIGIDATSLVQNPAPRAIQSSTTTPKTSPYFRRAGEGVAVVGLVGSLVNRGSYLNATSGLASYEFLRSAVNAAIVDDDISTIILDIDSAGGEAVGSFEAADHVREMALRKPIVASVTGLCCSAAFAIASGCSRIVMTRSSLAGSVGVVMLHADHSRRLDAAGVVPTLIFAGKHKVDGNAFQPLSEDVSAALQAEIDNYYTMFVETVARGRPRLDPDAVRATEARTYIGSHAVDIGLVDEIGTLGSVIADLSALDKKVRTKPYDKYYLANRLHGNAAEMHLRLKDAHVSGLRHGMATAMAEMKR